MPYSLINPVGFTTLNVYPARHTLNSSSDKAPFSNAPSTCPSPPISPSLSVSSTASTEFDFCPTPEEYSLHDLELMSVDELDGIMEDYFSSKKADVSRETEEKRLPKTRKLSDDHPPVFKVARRNEKTDVALERNRYAVLTKYDATQIEPFKLEPVVVQAEKIKHSLVFNVKSLIESLSEKEKQKFELQFNDAKKGGYKDAKSLEEYIQKILEQCGSQRSKNDFAVINKDEEIYSFPLNSGSLNSESRKNHLKIWLQFDKKNKNHVVGLYRPSVRVDHCNKLLNRIITSSHQVQAKLREMA